MFIIQLRKNSAINYGPFNSLEEAEAVLKANRCQAAYIVIEFGDIKDMPKPLSLDGYLTTKADTDLRYTLNGNLELPDDDCVFRAVEEALVSELDDDEVFTREEAQALFDSILERLDFSGLQEHINDISRNAVAAAWRIRNRNKGNA